MTTTPSDSSNPHASIPRFPLEWPLGWKRTLASKRRGDASFTKTIRTVTGTDIQKRTQRVGIAEAIERLERQVELLGGDHATLSTNVRVRLDGRLDTRTMDEPADPGVAIYFSFRGKATVLACDTFKRIADNLAALAAHIDALRRIERYGVGTIEQALAGYKALPADTAADWRVAFGLEKQASISVDDLNTRYRLMAKDRHPDHTHDDGAAMAWLNRARDYALQELEG